MSLFFIEMFSVAALLMVFRILEEKARQKYSANQWLKRLFYQLSYLVPAILILMWLLSKGYQVTYTSAIAIGAVIGLFGLDLLKLLRRKMK